MKRLIALALTAAFALVVSAASAADNPFPGTRGGTVFVSADTVNLGRTVTNYFTPGRKVVFRASAINMKTHKYVTRSEVKSFVVQIPNQPDLTLLYRPHGLAARGHTVWIGTWQVPLDYPLGTVPFKVVAKTTKQSGFFTQLPVASSQLTITWKPPKLAGPGPTTPPPAGSGLGDVPLFVDTVNGSRPPGAAPRQIGCTQTNVFKRGEQIVVRAFGFDMSDGTVLSPDNVTNAHFTVPGQPDVLLAWGAHSTPKVWYWTSFWNIPKDYPLGDIAIKVAFTTVGGKTGTLYYEVTIIP
jgi:hypothetical protein